MVTRYNLRSRPSNEWLCRGILWQNSNKAGAGEILVAWVYRFPSLRLPPLLWSEHFEHFEFGICECYKLLVAHLEHGFFLCRYMENIHESSPHLLYIYYGVVVSRWIFCLRMRLQFNECAFNRKCAIHQPQASFCFFSPNKDTKTGQKYKVCLS